MVVRAGSASDAAAAAALHADQIGEGFLSALGPRFLRRLYRRIALSSCSFLLVAECQGSAVGCIAGCTDVGTLYKTFAYRDGVVTAFASGGRLLRSWRLVIETLRHGTSHDGIGGELLAVAVDADAQGHGVGSMLVEEFLAEVTRRGGDAAYVVVAAGNEKAIALYRRAGFQAVDQFELHQGTKSLLMQWTAQPSNP